MLKSKRSSLTDRSPRFLALAVACTLASGCMTSRIEQERRTFTGVQEGESMVILARSYHAGHATEANFVDCVHDELASGSKPFDVYEDDQFLDDFYPHFEPRTAPTSPGDLPDLLQSPPVSKALTEAGIRYLVWVSGDTETLDGGGGISCAVGPGGGGCYGLTWFEKDSEYQATVWDLQQLSSAGRVSADINGMSVIPAVVIPIPLIAPTQTTACKRLADQLRVFLTDTAA